MTALATACRASIAPFLFPAFGPHCKQNNVCRPRGETSTSLHIKHMRLIWTPYAQESAKRRASLPATAAMHAISRCRERSLRPIWRRLIGRPLSQPQSPLERVRLQLNDGLLLWRLKIYVSCTRLCTSATGNASLFLHNRMTTGAEYFELVPLNPDYPVIRSDMEHAHIIGPAVEHRRFIRR